MKILYIFTTIFLTFACGENKENARQQESADQSNSLEQEEDKNPNASLDLVSNNERAAMNKCAPASSCAAFAGCYNVSSTARNGYSIERAYQWSDRQVIGIGSYTTLLTCRLKLKGRVTTRWETIHLPKN